MRSLTPAGAAALTGAVVCIAVLIEMDLTEPLNLNTSSLDLVIGGTTYYGLRGLGIVDDVKESSAEMPQVRFTLSAVDPTMISLALQEPVQGKAVRIKMALFDATTGAQIDVRLRYAGYLDVMPISDGKDSASISVTSESAILDLLRPANSYYNDTDQQTLHPGDLSMQYVNDQVDQKIVWPSASFFTKH